MATTPIHTFSGQKLEPYLSEPVPQSVAVRISASKTIARGTVLGQVTSGALFEAYSDADSPAGVGVARGIIAYDVISDAASLLTFGTTAASAGEFGEKVLSVPMYISGTFRAEDLTGLDANGLADLQGNIVSGTISAGIIRF
jgi:hypothetical protein